MEYRGIIDRTTTDGTYTECRRNIDGPVMVGGPAVGKAGDCLDWIAGGLEIKNSKI